MVADESGGILAARPNSDELPFKHMWHDDEAAMRINRQRHVLQTGFVDTMIGNFLNRLKSLGIYDESLVIITSDHGVSFQPGSARRNVYQGNLVEISAVPLLIKYPGNTPAGISDVNAQIMDIVPTILDVLDTSGWDDFDGISLVNPATVPPDVKVMREANKTAITTDADEHLLQLELAAVKTAKIYGEHDFPSIFRAGDRLGLTGQSVSELAAVGAPGPGLEINGADMFQRINLSGGFLPLVVHGKLHYEGEQSELLELALSVNGTLQAVSSLLTIPGKENEFEVLLPPSAFVEGENVLEAWLVSETVDGIALQRTATAGTADYQLSENSDGDTTLIIDGAEFEVEDRIVRGGARAVPGESEKLLLLSGWAVDLKNAVTAETVVIFIDNQFYSAFAPTQASNSVAERFNESGLANSGFRIPVAISSPEQAAAMEVRVFAISIEQRVSELSYPADEAQWPFKKNPR